LEIVAEKFLKMMSYYIQARVKNDDWKNFIEDLDRNLLFGFDMKVLK